MDALRILSSIKREKTFYPKLFRSAVITRVTLNESLRRSI